jgi:hypothetical protein
MECHFPVHLDEGDCKLFNQKMTGLVNAIESAGDGPSREVALSDLDVFLKVAFPRQSQRTSALQFCRDWFDIGVCPGAGNVVVHDCATGCLLCGRVIKNKRSLHFERLLDHMETVLLPSCVAHSS